MYDSNFLACHLLSVVGAGWLMVVCLLHMYRFISKKPSIYCIEAINLCDLAIWLGIIIICELYGADF